MIYEHVLVSSEDILPGKHAVDKDREELLYKDVDLTPAANLDARLLRTCRAICS